MTLKFDRWPRKPIGNLFHAPRSYECHFIAIRVTGNAQIRAKSSFFTLCDLKMWQMTLKNYRALFYATSSFVHHFKAISKFKLELQSGNTHFWSKLVIFLSYVTLKFDGWPWKTIGHLFYATSSVVHHFKVIGEFELELQYGNAQVGDFFIPWDLEIRLMTLKNNRAPLLCYLQLSRLTIRWQSVAQKWWKMKLTIENWKWILPNL